MRRLHAILIDPVRQSVLAVEHDGDYRQIYTYLSDPANGYDVHLFTAVGVDHRNTLFVDDEGLLKNPRHFFLWRGYSQPLAGRGFLIGNDNEGESVSTTWTVERVKDHVRFTDAIRVRDMLTSEGKEERWGQTFDVIKTTPVFGPPGDGEETKQ